MTDNNDSNKNINVSKDSNININIGVNSATFGIISFVIGIIGIFIISFILSPLALLFGVISLFREKSKIWGLLGVICAIIGAITSPILMGILGIGTLFSIM